MPRPTGGVKAGDTRDFQEVQVPVKPLDPQALASHLRSRAHPSFPSPAFAFLNAGPSAAKQGLIRTIRSRLGCLPHSEQQGTLETQVRYPD